MIRRVLKLALALVILHLVAVQPNHPGAMTWGALQIFAWELPVIVLLFLSLRTGRLMQVVRGAFTLVLSLIVALKAADFGMFTALNRGFNPATDLHLVEAAWRLGSGTIGVAAALASVAGALMLLLLVAAAIWWATGLWGGLAPRPPWRAAFATGAVVAAGLTAAQVGAAMGAWKLPADPPGIAFTARVGMERLAMLRAARADMREFNASAGADPFAAAQGLFDRLQGRDVQVIFVESYGHTSFVNPLYVPTHGATLRRAEAQLAEAGLAMRTGLLTSPVTGGQSWLAHGTLASGLRTGSQARYGAMLASQRATLYDLARTAGYHTIAVMPAITLPWPEGTLIGFETLLTAPDLGYRGKPHNWITMPDQYTYAAWPGLLPEDGRPRFTQAAMVSSHAPWIPVPDLIPWAEVGDGTVFDRWIEEADPPAVVWRDRNRVRQQYRLAVDYALQAAFAFALRQAEDPPLLVLLGDHQPSEFVSQDPSLDVPVHLIGPPGVIALFHDWGWAEGLRPGTTQAWPMEAFRDRFIRAVSSPAWPEDAS